MRDSPYVCRTCGQPWHTPYVRCIGTDGDHAPVFPVAREDNRRFATPKKGES